MLEGLIERRNAGRVLLEARLSTAKHIPRHIRNELNRLRTDIGKATESIEISHMVDFYRAMADPVTHNYDIRESNKQIALLNRHLEDNKYTDLQVRTY